MLPLLALALTAGARAEAVIEFKTSGPVAILVDGQQATLMSSLRQRATGLSPGVHQLEVSGMFGKKLYEAEIDIPDNTITYVAWEKGEIKVLKTEWLEDAPEETVAAAEDAGEAGVPTDLLAVTPPAAVPPAAVPPEAPPIAPAAEVPVDPLAAAPAADAPAVAPSTDPAVEALALPAPKPKTWTIQASDGMHIEVVNGQHKLVVVVDGTTFKIQDENGMSVAYSAE